MVSVMIRSLRIALLLALLLFGISWLNQRSLIDSAQLQGLMQRIKRHIITSPLLLHRNRLRLGDKAESTKLLELPLHSLEEFDRLTREQVYQKRMQVVAQTPKLAEDGYRPNELLFGQIVDGQPWWGIEGLYFHGPGMQAIDGLSEETRFFLNPFLLVSLQESAAFITKKNPVDFKDYYPKPLLLEFDAKNKRERVRYDVNGFYAFLKAVQMNDPEYRKLTLCTYNARDFGYNYLYLDKTQSRGVYWFADQAQPAQTQNFIHGSGSSCGYPGGCNNASPFQRTMQISLATLPAQAVFKLWFNLPKDPKDEADFTTIIEVVDPHGIFDLGAAKPAFNPQHLGVTN